MMSDSESDEQHQSSTDFEDTEYDSESEDSSEESPETDQPKDVTAKVDGRMIVIKVVCPHGDEVFFKLHRTTSLVHLGKDVAKRFGRRFEDLQFMYDGDLIQENDTPDSLDMIEHDVVDVVVVST